MFWFDPDDERVIFVDRRRESHLLDHRPGKSLLVIDPTIQADFTKLPFAENSFAVVVFDPPHLRHNGRNSWLAKKYGKLGKNWQEEISAGLREAFRVLRPTGVLIFKWNERDVPVKKILALTPYKPLIGNRCGKLAQTHWIVFMKPVAICESETPHSL